MSAKLNGSRIDVLDGIRGIAILLVFWHHASGKIPPSMGFGPFGIDLTPFSATGGYGVDLFFFLSGFCLFHPYARAHFTASPSPTLRHFISRRIAKIIPSYLIAVFGMLLVGYATFPSLGEAWHHIILHIFFLHTLFNDSFASIGSFLWSLGVEVEFYVLFPLIAWCMLREPILTLLGALTLGCGARTYGLHHPWMDIWKVARSLPLEIDLFVTGMFAAYAFHALESTHHTKRDPAWTWAWTFLALGGVLLYIAACAIVYKNAQERQMLPFLEFAFFAVTMGSLFGAPRWRSIVAHPFLTFYAVISYNLYLWHEVVLAKIPQHGIVPEGASHSLALMLLNFLCSTLLAILLTYGMERPLMRLLMRNPLER